MAPTIGRIVHYKLSAQDADAIESARTTAAARMAASGFVGAIPSVRSIGNQAQAGDVYPATVVRVFGSHPGAAVNLQVHLDGNDAYWATSRVEGDEPGQWRWPAYDPKATLQAVNDTAPAGAGG